MVRTTYECEKCGTDFEDRARAEEHERKPLIALPEGFIYFFSGSGCGEIRGPERNTDILHDVEYTFHSLRSLQEKWDLDPLIIFTGANRASSIRKELSKDEGGKCRYATDEEVKQVLSNHETVRILKNQGLTQLAIDLEGERTFPIVMKRE